MDLTTSNNFSIFFIYRSVFRNLSFLYFNAFTSTEILHFNFIFPSQVYIPCKIIRAGEIFQSRPKYENDTIEGLSRK